ncbi:hypothetical protein ACMD2_25540 [Ananas comosus]|uniref:Uncharacterized protein n=1 Tax=Ananas comosus TaxID=4615 RepID=A0A199UXZ9_ANACO|nr:hypothetical protein ACMD2_25540 [Ananas comosus]
MSDLISSSQSAFLKGRNIIDAYVAVRELNDGASTISGVAGSNFVYVMQRERFWLIGRLPIRLR